MDELDIMINMDDEISDLERKRAQNLKELELMMSEFDEEINETVKTLSVFEKQKPVTKKRKKPGQDETFTFRGHIPVERRRSGRLSNTAPKYTYDDLPDEPRAKIDDDDIENLEEIVYRKKQRSTSRRPTVVPFAPVDEITPTYLANIAIRTTIKQYSQTGTSCHQCRQKTLDSKTYCRSGRCVGVRGQFCGICLKNRYGEEAKDALLDPNWECPPCRGLCNCSICRTREGKRPTGILAPIAFRYGHKSVQDFLVTLKGEGDYLKDPPKPIIIRVVPKMRKYNCGGTGNCEHLLMGFTKDGKPVWNVNKKDFSFCDEDNDLLGFNFELLPVMIKN